MVDLLKKISERLGTGEMPRKQAIDIVRNTRITNKEALKILRDLNAQGTIELTKKKVKRVI